MGVGWAIPKEDFQWEKSEGSTVCGRFTKGVGDARGLTTHPRNSYRLHLEGIMRGSFLDATLTEGDSE